MCVYIYIDNSVTSKSSAAFLMESSTCTPPPLPVSHLFSLRSVVPQQQLHHPAAINTSATCYFCVIHQPVYN